MSLSEGWLDVSNRNDRLVVVVFPPLLFQRQNLMKLYEFVLIPRLNCLMCKQGTSNHTYAKEAKYSKFRWTPKLNSEIHQAGILLFLPPVVYTNELLCHLSLAKSSTVVRFDRVLHPLTAPIAFKDVYILARGYWKNTAFLWRFGRRREMTVRFLGWNVPVEQTSNLVRPAHKTLHKWIQHSARSTTGTNQPIPAFWLSNCQQIDSSSLAEVNTIVEDVISWWLIGPLQCGWGSSRNRLTSDTFRLRNHACLVQKDCPTNGLIKALHPGCESFMVWISSHQFKMEQHDDTRSPTLDTPPSFEPFTLSALDHIVPPLHLFAYLTFKLDSPSDAIAVLQNGISRLLHALHFLSGNIVTIEELNGKKNSMQITPADASTMYQSPMLKVALHAAETSAVERDDVQHADFVPIPIHLPTTDPSPVLRFQANMMTDGLVLCVTFDHRMTDGLGVLAILDSLAACCRGDSALTDMAAQLQKKAAACIDKELDSIQYSG